jgi:hypothetical protein
MRTVLLALSTGLLVALPAKADNWANKIFGGQPGTPIVQDFGTIARGAQLQATLKMTNIYKVPLTITNTSVSCRCVSVETPVGTVIPPSGTADFVIKMDGKLVTGLKQVYVNVTFGPQFVSTANIVVTANARQDVVLNPGEIDFGTVGRGQSVSRSIEVECAGKKDWRVLKVTKSEKAPFELRVENMPMRNTSGYTVIGYKLTATLKGDAVVGAFHETVDLETNDATQKTVSFLVVGKVDSPVAAAPNPVQLANLKLGSTAKATVVVQANQPFRITGVQGAGNDINLVVSQNQKMPVHIIEVQITPQTPGALSRELILQTDMGGESVKVRVQGNVNP